MNKQSIYKDLAQYYDLIYSFKDYESEVNKLIKIIESYSNKTQNKLLEVGCGSGKHLNYLHSKFECSGFDLNEGMIKVAKDRLKNKDVNIFVDNMINFNLNEKFDVIVCLFSSIGYVKTYENLKKTIQNFSKHLNEGGLVIIEPWFTKDVYIPGGVHLDGYSDENVKISRMCVSKLEDGVSIMDMNYLIGLKDDNVYHYVDRHELGLFETDITLEYLNESGLKAKFINDGFMKDRGLFIGEKVN